MKVSQSGVPTNHPQLGHFDRNIMGFDLMGFGDFIEMYCTQQNMIQS